MIWLPPPASSTRFFSRSWNSGSKVAISFARPSTIGGDDRAAGRAHLLGDVERRRLAVDRQLDDDRRHRCRRRCECFSLISLIICDRELRLGVASCAISFDELVVDEVAGERVRDLVGVLGHRAVHPAQVGRAGADVDHEHVVEHVEAVGDRERLGAQHHGVDRLARGLDDRVLVVDRGLGRARRSRRRRARPCAACAQADDLADQVRGRLQVAFDVVASCRCVVLDHAGGERAVEVAATRRCSTASSPKRTSFFSSLRLTTSFG